MGSGVGVAVAMVGVGVGVGVSVKVADGVALSVTDVPLASTKKFLEIV